MRTRLMLFVSLILSACAFAVNGKIKTVNSSEKAAWRMCIMFNVVINYIVFNKGLQAVLELFSDKKFAKQNIAVINIYPLNLSCLSCHDSRLPFHVHHSHSIVAGGLLLISYTTRFIPLTLLMMLLEICARNS